MACGYTPYAEFTGGGRLLSAGGSATIAAAATLPPANCAGCASFRCCLDTLKIFVADPGGFSLSCQPGRHSYNTNAAFEDEAERAGEFYLF